MGIAAIVIALPSLEYFSARKGSSIAYNGKSLEYWLSQTPSTKVLTNGSMTIRTITLGSEAYGADSENLDDVKRAFHAIGTNCVPYLVKRLEIHDTRISRAIESLKYRLKMRSNRLERDWQRGQAVTALMYLDPLPDETYEQIRALSKSSNPDVAASARYILRTSHQLSDAQPIAN